ncbi:unnamed protein product [Nippostrongylus brasiliensis]|uniref:Nucleolin-like n=1 Tax=Nippostrongylus brasiliensis TaxID=27835 RepID=A0A0N4XMS8_NIPBR|nr:unnamed protein product [Nippostrongylus brasiliensis]
MKDPHVLDSLMGIKSDTDGIPSVKVTRSKVKHSTEPAKVELKPVPPPRTFLDVQFENEDDDEDYRPEELQSDDSEDDEEGNETLTTNDHEKTCDKDDALDETIVNADRDENVVGSNLMVSHFSSKPLSLFLRFRHLQASHENLVPLFFLYQFSCLPQWSNRLRVASFKCLFLIHILCHVGVFDIYFLYKAVNL